MLLLFNITVRSLCLLNVTCLISIKTNLEYSYENTIRRVQITTKKKSKLCNPCRVISYDRRSFHIILVVTVHYYIEEIYMATCSISLIAPSRNFTLAMKIFCSPLFQSLCSCPIFSIHMQQALTIFSNAMCQTSRHEGATEM